MADFYFANKAHTVYSTNCKKCHGEHTTKNRHKYYRKIQLKYVHGITLEQWNALFEKQKHACAICGATNRRFCLDHDHVRKQIRGILCHNCNVVLGLMNDDPARLIKAANYLKTP